MNTAITYRDTQHFTPGQIQELFLSVDWSSGRHPETVCLAMAGSHAVLSAWDGNRLVGLANAISDGHAVAYVPYVLVHPEYQGKGIGKALIHGLLAKYEGLLRCTLVAYDKQVPFYERCGFHAAEAVTAMHVTSLTT